MPDHATDAADWMANHPRAMAIFERMALRRAATGRAFGMKQLAEVVRWEMTIDMAPGDAFKLNNNHISYIARALIEKHPHIAAFIETRRAGSEAA